MDFMFDREASGGSIKCLEVVDDATHESVAIVADQAIGGDHLTRILSGICSQRGTPAVTRTGNGPEFTGRAMLNWAHCRGIALRLIERGKRTRTRTWSRSTDRSATNASTSTG